jgi:hypothetical protein
MKNALLKKKVVVVRQMVMCWGQMGCRSCHRFGHFEYHSMGQDFWKSYIIVVVEKGFDVAWQQKQ